MVNTRLLGGSIWQYVPAGGFTAISIRIVVGVCGGITLSTVPNRSSQAMIGQVKR